MLKLGVIQWDFQHLTMSLVFNDQKITLNGLSNPKLIVIGRLPHSNSLETKGVILQLLQHQGTANHEEIPMEIRDLLINCQDLVVEPKGLPLTRTHDHSIIL